MPDPKRLLIVGAGGHARVVASVVLELKSYRLAGFVDRHAPDRTERILGAPVIGMWGDIEKLYRKGIQYAALAIGDNRERERLQKRLLAIGYRLPVLMHPTAHVEKSAAIGQGTLIAAGAMVGTLAVIGEGSIINTGAIIDHETVLGTFVHVAPGSTIAGRVRIGHACFIGIGARVIDQVSIGASAVIGAGAVVLSNIPAGKTAVGIPARVRRSA